MNSLIARKVGMTQIFDENSKAFGVTVLDVSDCRVVQIKNNEVDGYHAAQLTIGTKKNSTKPLQNHFKKYNSEPGEIVFEVEVDESFELDPGAVVKASDVFEVGQKVDISGISKGKGFQGVVKRHGFAGVGQATHGQHNRLRAPGSIGAASYPARVFKGMKMAGRMGGEKVKVMNLRVLKVMPEKNLLLVKGCVPGHKNSYLIIQK